MKAAELKDQFGSEYSFPAAAALEASLATPDLELPEIDGRQTPPLQKAVSSREDPLAATALSLDCVELRLPFLLLIRMRGPPRLE